METIAVENSDFDKYLENLSKEIDAALIQTMHETYDDIKNQLDPHLKSEARRPYDRPPGALELAIDESEKIVQEPLEDGDIRYVGLGYMPLLEKYAPHWKYLEYGTLEQGQGEWGDNPYLPGNSPMAEETRVAQKIDKTISGIAPNRAWRLGYWNAQARLYNNIGKLFKTRRRKRR